MKRTSVHSKNIMELQLKNRKVRDFDVAFRVRNLFGTFEKRTAGEMMFMFLIKSSKAIIVSFKMLSQIL